MLTLACHHHWMCLCFEGRLIGRGFCRHRSVSNSKRNSGPSALSGSFRCLYLSKRSAEDNESSAVRQRNYEQLMNASKLSLAPMMDYTDRHFRHLVRLISSDTLLYTEMVSGNALSYERKAAMAAYGNKDGGASETNSYYDTKSGYLRRFLEQSPLEGASVLQLGGSDPLQMYEAAQCVMEMDEFCDYTALNLNCGCPSPKVAGKGCFGAALMDDPNLVADITAAMDAGCHGRLPITVKCRIGTDSPLEQDNPDYEYRRLCHFVETVAAKGIVTDFSIHARIAVLSRKFSPADNRKIPPLKYDYVRRLVRDYSPDLTFTLNGGLETLAQVQQELEACPGLNGAMIGRAWAADPWSFATTDQMLYGKDTDSNGSMLPRNRLEVLQAFGKYADEEEALHDPHKIRRFLVKAITQLFAGEPNAKRYRIALDEIVRLHKAGTSSKSSHPLSELILNCALENLPEDVLLRSRQESYEMALEEKQRNNKQGTSLSVQEWQLRRKQEESGSYETMLLAAGENN